MRFLVPRAVATAAASVTLLSGAAAQAGTFTVLNATGSSSFSISQSSSEGSTTYDSKSYNGLGTYGFSNANGGGTAALLTAPSVHTVFSANNTGSAGASMTYEFVFTSTHAGEVQSLIQQSNATPITCASSPNLPPCVLPPPQEPNYYIPAATTITGTYVVTAGGYARGEVQASAYGVPEVAGSVFDVECGYGSSSEECVDRYASGTFNIFGALMANEESIAANSFYGFITLSASGRVFEGGDFDAFIDPIITLNLAGVDPHDFTLSISPNLVASTSSGAPEPATWAMMLTGFGGLGAALRRRRTPAAAA